MLLPSLVKLLITIMYFIIAFGYEEIPMFTWVSIRYNEDFKKKVKKNPEEK